MFFPPVSGELARTGHSEDRLTEAFDSTAGDGEMSAARSSGGVNPVIQRIDGLLQLKRRQLDLEQSKYVTADTCLGDVVIAMLRKPAFPPCLMESEREVPGIQPISISSEACHVVRKRGRVIIFKQRGLTD